MRLEGGEGRRRATIVIALLLIVGMLPPVPAPSARAQSPPQLRAVPWDGCESPCAFLGGINNWENVIDIYRFRVEVVSEHQPVTIEWSGKSVAGNPASGNLPDDALIGGVPVAGQSTVVGGTTFEWNPGEDTGSLEDNCFFPSTGNTANGNCYWVTITATDSLDQATSVDVYLRVIEDVNPPSIEVLAMSPADGTVDIGEELTFTVAGTDTDIPSAKFMSYSLFEDPGDPSGATIDPDTGEFRWTPTVGQDGAYLMPIGVQEIDPDLPPAQLGGGFVEVPIVVGTGNRPPIVEVETPVIQIDAGDLAETEFSYYDLDFTNQTLTASLVGGPPGAGIFPSDDPDTFTWQSTAADDGQSFVFHLEVTDGVDTTSVPITVNVGIVPPVQISITESVVAADEATVAPPVLIQLTESVGVSDAVGVSPPVQISITESINVRDDVTMSPAVLIAVSEAIDVSDSVTVTPPLVIAVSETVRVAAQVTATLSSLGSVRGLKWEDTDGDAIRDTDEPAIEGVIIYLDLDDDASLDGNEPSTTTDADGSYEFTGLVPGEWVVRELVPTGFGQTFPAAEDEGEHRVTLTADEEVLNLDFGNRPTPNLPPMIEPIDDVVVDVGDSIEIPVMVTDPEGDPFTKSVEGLPRGIINGVIPFEPLPEEAGMVFAVNVTAVQDDNPNNFDTETFTVTVTDRPPVIEPIDDVFGLVGSEIVVVPVITDPEGHDFTITWEGGPPNAIINGIWVLTPTKDQAESIFEITLIATEVDNPANSTSETFSVLVAGVPDGPTDPLDVDPVSAPGDDIEIEGGGFLPGSDVKIYFLSEPVLLGAEKVGPDGTVSASFALPDEASDGPHQIVVVGLDQNGGLRTLSADIDVVRDSDDDGLRDTEEAMTGTDPENPDTDGDGLIDGIDASWLIDFLDQLDSDDFKRRWHRGAMKLTVGAAALAVNFGDGDLALDILDSLDRRVDGCGANPDRSDWIVDCQSQLGFRQLLDLYRRGIETLPLPDPFPWW